jgi:hypothetical protein
MHADASAGRVGSHSAGRVGPEPSLPFISSSLTVEETDLSICDRAAFDQLDAHRLRRQDA